MSGTYNPLTGNEQLAVQGFAENGQLAASTFPTTTGMIAALAGSEVPVDTGITAHASGGQANATILKLGAFNNITTVANAADSVKLPASFVGATATVSNQGANAAQIFGTSPDTINGVATGTGISIPVGAIFVFTCAVAGNWLQNVQTGGAFTGTFDGVLGGNTPAAASVTTLNASGVITATSAALTTPVTSGLRQLPATTLTAAGTNQGSGLALTADINNVTTAASGTGVVLPAATVGRVVTVFNNGANAIQVYGNGSNTIDGTAGATGVVLTNAKRCQYFCVAAATWLSAQLGVTSA